MNRTNLIKDIAEFTGGGIILVDVLPHAHPHPYAISKRGAQLAKGFTTPEVLREAETKGARCGMYQKGNKITPFFRQGYTPCTLTYDEHVLQFIPSIQVTEDVTLETYEEFEKKYLAYAKDHPEIPGLGFADQVSLDRVRALK